MIDEVLAELAELGWLLNNCYQHDDLSWRVNLRRPTLTGDWFTDWAEADTFHDALLDCMTKLNDAEFVEAPTATATIDRTKPLSLLDLIAKSAPTTPFPRRL